VIAAVERKLALDCGQMSGAPGNGGQKRGVDVVLQGE
jgi:hypothetical protein